MKRFEVLDGWRGISILLVLAGHLLPLGPKAWQMNEAVAATGMVLFFILSGFLITNLLIKDQNVGNFLIRRFMRIIPLAWLFLIIILSANNASIHDWFPLLLFYANWPPMGLIDGTGHLWSLCVEVQFYISIALLVLFFRKKAFLLLPFICLFVTLYRVYSGVPIAINTYYRVDEILAGCILALICHKNSFELKKYIKRLNSIVLFVLLIGSAHYQLVWLNYLRPYIALLLVGSTLFAHQDRWDVRLLKSKFLFFVASISYALYIIHGGLTSTWLGQGDTLERYIKRPLLILVTFILAYISTNYYEQYWIRLGKKLTHKPKFVEPVREKELEKV